MARLIRFLVLIVLCCSSSYGMSAAPQATSTATISGTVSSTFTTSQVNSTGLMVTLKVFKSTDTAQTSPVVQATTSSSGSYSVKVAAGSYVLRADPTPDYKLSYYGSSATVGSFSQATVVTVVAGKTYSGLNLKLPTNLIDMATAFPIVSSSVVQASEPSGLVWHDGNQRLYFVSDQDKTNLYTVNTDGSGTDRFALAGTLNDVENAIYVSGGATNGQFYLVTSQSNNASGVQSADRQRACTFKLSASNAKAVDTATWKQVNFSPADGTTGHFRQLLQNTMTAAGITVSSSKGVNVEGLTYVSGSYPDDLWLVGIKTTVTSSGQAILMLVKGFYGYYQGVNAATVVAMTTVNLHGQSVSDLSYDPVHNVYLMTSGDAAYSGTDPQFRLYSLSFTGLLSNPVVTELAKFQAAHQPEGVTRILRNPANLADPANNTVALVFDDGVTSSGARYARFLTLVLP